jgi:hypothetical protein
MPVWEARVRDLGSSGGADEELAAEEADVCSHG